MKLQPRGVAPPLAPAPNPTPPACEHCRERGYIPLGAQPTPGWGTAEGLRAALERGQCCLCTCSGGRWWRDWFRDLAAPLRDRDGRHLATGFHMPTQGIPDFGERAA